MSHERRGLRFPVSVGAEVASESAPADFVPARVTELSLSGCFLETSTSFDIQCSVLLKISDSEEYFETKATVLYVRPSGMGLVFREIRPQFREVLQKWVLKALDKQLDAQQTAS